MDTLLQYLPDIFAVIAYGCGFYAGLLLGRASDVSRRVRDLYYNRRLMLMVLCALLFVLIYLFFTGANTTPVLIVLFVSCAVGLIWYFRFIGISSRSKLFSFTTITLGQYYGGSLIEFSNNRIAEKRAQYTKEVLNSIIKQRKALINPDGFSVILGCTGGVVHILGQNQNFSQGLYILLYVAESPQGDSGSLSLKKIG